MAKNLDVREKDCFDSCPTLSQETINGLDIFQLSEMIMSLEYAIHYTKECLFALSFVGIEETSGKIKAVMNELEDYLEFAKSAHKSKINGENRMENFMKDVNA